MWKRFRRWLLRRRITLLALEIRSVESKLYGAQCEGDLFAEHHLQIYLDELNSRLTTLAIKRASLN